MVALVRQRHFSGRSWGRSRHYSSCQSLELLSFSDLHLEKPCAYTCSAFGASHPSASQLDSNCIFLSFISISELTLDFYFNFYYSFLLYSYFIAFVVCIDLRNIIFELLRWALATIRVALRLSFVFCWSQLVLHASTRVTFHTVLRRSRHFSITLHYLSSHCLT